MHTHIKPKYKPVGTEEHRRRREGKGFVSVQKGDSSTSCGAQGKFNGKVRTYRRPGSG